MSEASNMNFKISYEGGGGKAPRVSKMVTLDSIKEWIKAHQLDTFTTEGLIDLASKYPQQALPAFRKNFSLMLARVRQKRKKEFGELPGEKHEKQEADQKINVSGNFDEAFKSFAQNPQVEKPQEEAVEEQAEIPELRLPDSEFDDS